MLYNYHNRPFVHKLLYDMCYLYYYNIRLLGTYAYVKYQIIFNDYTHYSFNIYRAKTLSEY